MKKATVQIDQAGRLVLPKPVRERFRLKSGDTLSLDVRGDAIELRPIQATVRLERVNGVLVLKGIAVPQGADLVADAREERLSEFVEQASRKR